MRYSLLLHESVSCFNRRIESNELYGTQRLSDEEALARTETTIKMANVLGESADKVSNYMTSIWNNFAKGSQDLEIYADKITALGAATASSSEEIATGLEKFAAVAEASGLSYDYATSALATVVATTRQSADTVGTAFKTIFARIQGLQLGETLDDGTDLNKYSQALYQAGINIKDQNGQLKDMDNILDEMGAKWQLITKDQQLALAQTVAGTRQYNQLIALMDNWDFMRENLKTTAEAAGTLNEQQEIYMESLGAHLQKLRTETERTYQAIFETDSMNDIIDGVTSVLDKFNDFIEGLGGAGATLTFFTGALTNLFNKQITSGITNVTGNLKTLAMNRDANLAKEEVVRLNAASGTNINENTTAGKEALKAQVAMYQDILKVKKGLTQESANELVAIQKQVGERVLLKESLTDYLGVFDRLVGQAEANNVLVEQEIKDREKNIKLVKDQAAEIVKLQKSYSAYSNAAEATKGSNKESQDLRAGIQNFMDNHTGSINDEDIKRLEDLKKLSESQVLTDKEHSEIQQIISKYINQQEQEVKELNEALKQKKLHEEGYSQVLEEEIQQLKAQAKARTDAAQKQVNIQRGLTILSSSVMAVTAAAGGLTQAFDESNDSVTRLQGKISATTGILSGLANGVASAFLGPMAGMIVSSLVTLVGGFIGEALVKTEKEALEKIENIKNEWKKLEEDTASTNSSIERLKSLESEFAYLSSGVSEYGDNISLTSEQFSKYKDIVNEIADISPKMVKGYTDEGDAIINNNGAIQTTIDLLKQERLERQKNLLTEDNINTYGEGLATDYNNAQTAYNKAKSRQEDAWETLDNKNQLENPDSQSSSNVMGVGLIEKFLRDNEDIINNNSDLKDTVKTLRELYLVDGEIDLDAIIKNRAEIAKLFSSLYNSEDKRKAFGKSEDYFNTFFDGDGVNKGESYSSTYSNIGGWLEYMNGYVVQYEQASEELEQEKNRADKAKKGFNDKVLLWLELNNKDYADMANYERSYIQSIVNSYETTGFGDADFDLLTEQAKNTVDAFLNTNEQTQKELIKLTDPSNFNTYAEYQNELNRLTEEGYGDLLPKINTSKIDSKVAEFNAQLKTTLGAAFDVSDYFSANQILTGSIENLGGINFSAISGMDEFEQVLTRISNEKGIQVIAETFKTIQERIAASNTALEEFNTSGKISEDNLKAVENQYKNVLNSNDTSLKHLKELYGQLQSIEDKSSHEYISTLRKIREEDERLARRNLENQRDEYQRQLDYMAKHPITIEAEVTRFEETMQKLLDTEYAIKVQVDTDLKTDVEDGFGIIQQLNQIKSQIVDDLTITSEEAQKIVAAGYGAILEGAQLTADNEILINKDIMNAVIDAKQQEVEADKQAKIAQLENERTVLAAQRDILDKRLEHLKIALEAEKSLEAANALLNAENEKEKYNTAVRLLGAELDAQEDKGIEEEKINQKIYDTLGEMHLDYTEGVQQADIDAGEQDTIQAQKRFDNAKAIYDAYVAVGAAKGESVFGPVTTPWVDGSRPTDAEKNEIINNENDLEDGKKQSLTKTNVGSAFVKSGEYHKELLDFAKNVESKNAEDVERYRATIEKIIEDTLKEKDRISGQIGSIDGVIQALNSTSFLIDSAQDKAAIGGSDKVNSNEKASKLELNTYHDIERVLGLISDKLSTLEKQKSHLFGKQLIDKIKEENYLLTKQYEAYESLDKLIQQDLSNKRAELSAYNVTFADNGEISNYAAAYNQAYLNYINAIESYNNSARSEADKQALDNAKETFKEFESLIKDYDTILDKQLKNNQDKLELEYKILENNYKAWETEIQVSLDLSEAKRDWKNFMRDISKDFRTTLTDFEGDMEHIVSSFKDYQFSTFAVDMTAIEKIKQEIINFQNNPNYKSSIYASESEAAQDLMEKSARIREDGQAMYDLMTQGWDTYLGSIDNLNNEIGKVIETFDDIGDSIKHNMNLIDLLYGDGDTAKELKRMALETQNANNIANLNNLRIANEGLAELREELIAKGSKETDEDIQKIDEAIKKNNKELENSIEEFVKTAKEKFELSVQIASNNMEKALTGGHGFDTLSERWEDAEKASEGYYDNIERIYKLESLETQWEGAIASAKTLNGQKKLKGVMDSQLEALRNKTELSEYDVELANKQLLIAQAQVALEESQNAKNSMKLVRGADGNWSYQYIADEEEVANKQQELFDRTNDYYTFTKDKYKEVTEEAFTYAQEYQTRITELMANFETLTAEEQEKVLEEADRLYELYWGGNGLVTKRANQLGQIEVDARLATTLSLKTLHEEDARNYELMTDEEKRLTEDLNKNNITSFQVFQEAVSGPGGVYDSIKETADAVLTDNETKWANVATETVKKWRDNPDSFENSIKGFYTAVQGAQTEFDTAIETGTTAAGINFGNVSGALDTLKGKIDASSSSMDTVIKKKDDIPELKTAVDQMADAWKSVYENIKTANTNLGDYLKSLGGISTSVPTPSLPTNSSQSSGGGSSSSSSSSSAGSAPAPQVSAPAPQSTSHSYTVKSGDTLTGIARQFGNEGRWRDIYSANQGAIDSRAKQEGDYDKVRNDFWNWVYPGMNLTIPFDTGGYTGDWNGGDGRIAMLHSKELVLNKEDTENILNAVSAVRDISSVGSSIANYITNGIANMMNSLNGLNSFKYKGLFGSSDSTNNNTFDITMNIDGGDVEEIKEAILSLPTLASQYISKR